MPTQEQIDALHNSLLTKAQIIEDKLELLAQMVIEKQEAQNAVELRRAQLHAPIAANRITYTNEPQRFSALVEQTANDISFQTKLQTEYTATVSKASLEAEVELNRKLYRADELLLLYYANSAPTS